MAFFRKIPQLPRLLDMFSKEQRWCILVNADPDALASAMALKRIMAHRVEDAAIARVNEITRPDNLEMISSLRIPVRKLTPNLAAQYDRFALVDSQPHHHPEFAARDIAICIDHHPASAERPVRAEYVDICAGYGAVATRMTEYLYNLRIRPGMLLATALLYAIKADTQSFERPFADVDVRAFQYLSRRANQPLLRKIHRSEFRPEWLVHFPRALERMVRVGHGLYAYLGEMEEPDLLVVLADFFLRIQGVGSVLVCGRVGDTVVAIFRGDGLRRDMGKAAVRLFGDLGSAGGHRSMARAEFPVSAAGGEDLGDFLWSRIQSRRFHSPTAPGVCPVGFRPEPPPSE
ncbi:MAG: phosphoesterase [Thermodesulfobacteriota bacterium]